MDKKTALRIGYRQLALDYNAQPEDFRSGRIVFTRPALNSGRRIYRTEKPFFEMAAVGSSTVIMADERLRPALEQWTEGVAEPHWLLEFPRLLSLSEILNPYGYELTQTFHQYLPVGGFAPLKSPAGLTLKWLEREGIARFYPNQEWPNALQEQENPSRPDVLALAALDGERIVGLAGASMDAPDMWQIGIDVLPEYRGRRLGTLLVRGLAAGIEKRGAMPFYGTSLSNLHSQNIAWSTGFFPAWVVVSARRKEQT